MHGTRVLRPGLAIAMTLLLAPAARAQTLGSIDFPTSAGAAAQAEFLLGVGYLHSFEYDLAAESFRRAQRLEPGFAMAYWGEAMTHAHPVWNQKDAVAARAVLARLAPSPEARAAKAGTARERGYLRAVEVLYGEGDKARLDTLYSREMEKLSTQYPDDDEARSFFALSLLGLSQGVRSVPAYMRAGAIALDVMSRKPDHPGAAHYAIHAFDDPVHAPLGLHAARIYSRVAPDAPHAQHMTTHIFLALGMWDDVIAQNEVAAGAREAYTPNHYTAWRLYALLQAGRHDEALRHLEITRRNMQQRPPHMAYLAVTRAHYLIDSERWSDSSAFWNAPAGTPEWGIAPDAFAMAFAALRRGDDAARARHHARLVEQAADTANQVANILLLSLRGAEAQAAGRSDEAISLVREAAAREEALPVEFGPPVIVKPSHELLGELLLAAGRGPEAVAAFRKALELAPNRWLSLRGLARAAAMSGDDATAERARTTWAAIWRAADSPLSPAAKRSR